MVRNKRRHRTGFGYIGFGNSFSVFNQHSNKAFSSLKAKLDSETHLHFQLNFTHEKLTKAEKEIIKNKIRANEKVRLIKTTIVFIFAFLVILFLIKLLIDRLMTNL